MSQFWSWSRTLDLLSRQRIHDVLLIAIGNDEASGPTVDALGDVYLQLDDGYLECISVNNHGGLRVRRIDAIDMQGYRDEFGLDAIAVRIGSLFWGPALMVKCTQVNYVTNEESNLDRGIVRCVELVLEHGNRVALDPMYTTGVRIGNTNAWLEDNLYGTWTFQHHTEVYS
ncbi:hypothetical protein [Actinoplanes sp. NPDC049802]|uniref:hypothetical protein n=1 Tax=Actinoplanes sp. NPDC049802 TaxID=3154742 RepID=UPI0033C07F7F